MRHLPSYLRSASVWITITWRASEKEDEMALTRDFKDTVQARARRDPAFGQALLQEAVAMMLKGDLQAGKAVLRDDIT